MKRLALVLTLAAPCVATAQAPLPGPVTVERVRHLLFSLAADSMEGRLTGAPGSARAARFIEHEMRRSGIQPGVEGRYFMPVPLYADSVGRPRLAESWAALDSVPAARRVTGGNVVGFIPGTDPAVAREVVLVSAHYDHVGMRRPPGADTMRTPIDSVYNGADDDASGVVTILEVARQLTLGPGPKRSVVILAITGEERGGLGSRWYLAAPVRPIEQTVANLNVEMVARPDSLAGGRGKAWLTGYERSNMGEQLAAGGVPIVADPRPEQNFFRRSDNYRFAVAGIPAHTLSSFNLHRDYHQPSDEPDKADLEHMRQVIEATVRAVRILTDGPRPAWKEGGRPEGRVDG